MPELIKFNFLKKMQHNIVSFVPFNGSIGIKFEDVIRFVSGRIREWEITRG